MAPARLRQQAWLAALLLFSPWLAAVLFCRSLVPQRPAAVLLLLPGLAVAISLHWQLARHLASNHRYGEEDQLFATLGAANWITLLRAAAVVGLAGFLPAAFDSGHGLPESLDWTPGLIYLGIGLADLLDGMVARRQHRETELGKRLDIETDAAGLLVASLLAVGLGRLPAAYLLVGLAYYPFILGIRLRRRRGLPVVALRPRPFARIIAGFQMGLVAMALLPLLDPAFAFLAAYLFMTPLLAGFVRDWLVVSCRLETDGNQQTALDRRAGRLWITLPPVLRLLVLAGGIAVLVDAGAGIWRAHPFWQMALSACCMLAVTGCMGRSAGLALALLLGGSLSPLGVSLASMILFAAAALLMLTGAGTLALWSPEEGLLYRRPCPACQSGQEAFDLTGGNQYHHQ